MVFTLPLFLQVQPFFYVVVYCDNININFVQPHENFQIQCRIQCRSHYNALHFKAVIIYRRSHNLPINNDSPSHYLPGNFDWGVIINHYSGNKLYNFPTCYSSRQCSIDSTYSMPQNWWPFFICCPSNNTMFPWF